MLNTLSKEINEELQQEDNAKFFHEFLNENFAVDEFIDNTLLALNENGVDGNMLKNEMPFLFVEDTVVDDDLITTLQHEIDYEDKYSREYISDLDDTTDLQEPEDYEDDYTFSYAADAEADTDLDDEVDFEDNQTTPVNIDEFSNESFDFLLDEECCDDMEDEPIDADINWADNVNGDDLTMDTDIPDLDDLDGVPMEEESELDMDIDSDESELEESLYLFESDDEYEEDEDEDKEEDSEDEEEDDDDDSDEDEEDSDDDILDESFLFTLF